MDADKDPSHKHFVFPKWSNLLLPLIVINAVGAPLYLHVLVPLAASPTTLNVGYQPIQPVPYSHDVHVGQLGMDCRYCHSSVENASFAAVPSTDTCMNCHHAVYSGGDQLGKPPSEKLLPVFESYYPYKNAVTGYPTPKPYVRQADGKGVDEPGEGIVPNEPNPKAGMPVQWVKVHDLPDYAYFNHAVHLAGGVSCVECHGRVDRMGEDGVYTVENLSMSWCLDCHRNTERSLRPRDEVFNLAWGDALSQEQVDALNDLKIEGLQLAVGDRLTPAQRKLIGERHRGMHHVPSARNLTDCSTCHR